MNEVAWCYLEGFGCKKDKVSNLCSSPFLPCNQTSSSFWYGHDVDVEDENSSQGDAKSVM